MQAMKHCLICKTKNELYSYFTNNNTGGLVMMEKTGANRIERALIEINNRLDRMEGEIGEIKNRLDRIESEIGEIKDRLDRIEQKVELMDLSHEVLMKAIRRGLETEGEEFEELRDSFVSDPSGYNSTKWILGRKI